MANISLKYYYTQANDNFISVKLILEASTDS